MKQTPEEQVKNALGSVIALRPRCDLKKRLYAVSAALSDLLLFWEEHPDLWHNTLDDQLPFTQSLDDLTDDQWTAYEKIEEELSRVHILDSGAVRLDENGALEYAPMNTDGSIAEDEWYEVTDPESQDFLDAVNKATGSKFTMDGFYAPLLGTSRRRAPDGWRPDDLATML